VVRQAAQRGWVTGLTPIVQQTARNEDTAAQGAATLALDDLFAADDHPLASAAGKGGQSAAG
ncbi:MAG: hypothetical protein ACR2JY_13680, partial [Chloroflexota bacterium]